MSAYLGVRSSLEGLSIPDQIESACTRYTRLFPEGVVVGKLCRNDIWSARPVNSKMLEFLFLGEPSDYDLDHLNLFELPMSEEAYSDLLLEHKVCRADAVRIVNQRKNSSVRSRPGAVQIPVDRRSVFGNPFVMNSESERDYVCHKYEVYFWNRLATDQEFMQEALNVAKIAETEDVDLVCWCAPKRCHGEELLKFINAILKSKGYI